MDHKRIKKLLIPLVIAVVLVCAAYGLIIGRMRRRSYVTDEAAFRMRPKAEGEIYVDPEVLQKGGSALQGEDYQSLALKALQIVNEERKKAGLSQLHWDESLAACAMVRAMELPDSFSHVRPNGENWYTVCPDLMYGENLACGFDTAEQAVTAWMESPKHQENILRPGFVSCGIGVYRYNGRLYWGQEFSYYESR